ncbi:MAG: UDP-N-acetylglucosamine 2-epimerase (non-hydrolyzing) [Alicyclobacillus sp.]|nr:UDP-N-acetylglucosamine 2-epimerase (non-hydrolyzing) [Alicyclobacillus sp.]
MKILTVVGARPQFIKASVVSRLLRKRSGIEERIVHTGQHYHNNMSAVFFDELGIPKPEYNLHIGSGNHGAQTGAMLQAIEEVLLSYRPDYVAVYGDTNSTLAGALAAAKLHIPVAHVEAGLRSFNRKMPEEINRVLTDHLSTSLFAPTTTAVKNLEREGIAGPSVHLVGDVMYDAVLHFSQLADERSGILSHLQVSPKSYILATIHRAENTDDVERLQTIFNGLSAVSRDIPVVMPLHPRTRRVLEAAGLTGSLLQSIRICDPVGYLDMTMLEKSALVIVTDSGGVQKEAFFHKVPCVTLRTETEWIELVELGWNTLLSPNDPAEIGRTIRSAIGQQGRWESPYGEGDASMKICDVLCRLI